MRAFYNEYVEIAKYAFAAAGGAALAWTIVRSGRNLVESASKRVAELGRDKDAPQLGDDE